jgi:hypothetical protein
MRAWFGDSAPLSYAIRRAAPPTPRRPGWMPDGWVGPLPEFSRRLTRVTLPAPRVAPTDFGPPIQPHPPGTLVRRPEPPPPPPLRRREERMPVVPRRPISPTDPGGSHWHHRGPELQPRHWPSRSRVPAPPAKRRASNTELSAWVGLYMLCLGSDMGYRAPGLYLVNRAVNRLLTQIPPSDRATLGVLSMQWLAGRGNPMDLGFHPSVPDLATILRTDATSRRSCNQELQAAAVFVETELYSSNLRPGQCRNIMGELAGGGATLGSPYYYIIGGWSAFGRGRACLGADGETFSMDFAYFVSDICTLRKGGFEEWFGEWTVLTKQDGSRMGRDFRLFGSYRSRFTWEMGRGGSLQCR